jgi:hypothetical protein
VNRPVAPEPLFPREFYFNSEVKIRVDARDKVTGATRATWVAMLKMHLQASRLQLPVKLPRDEQLLRQLLTGFSYCRISELLTNVEQATLDSVNNFTTLPINHFHTTNKEFAQGFRKLLQIDPALKIIFRSHSRE